MSRDEKSDEAVVCARQRVSQEGSSPSGARIGGAVSKSGGNASLAKVMFYFGGQGVHREVGSEGFEEKHRAVIEEATPLMNRSAKDGARSSPHYGDEGVLIHPYRTKVCADGTVWKINA
ncbi:MAG: hypothetical protein AB8B79_12400 [Granulosicoccus sp.]